MPRMITTGVLSCAVMDGDGNDWVAYSGFEKLITWRMGDGIKASFCVEKFFPCCCDYWRSSLLYDILAGFFFVERYSFWSDSGRTTNSDSDSGLFFFACTLPTASYDFLVHLNCRATMNHSLLNSQISLSRQWLEKPSIHISTIRRRDLNDLPVPNDTTGYIHMHVHPPSIHGTQPHVHTYIHTSTPHIRPPQSPYQHQRIPTP